MDKLRSFLAGSYDEIKTKVSWPTYDELQKSSSLVLVASLIFAVVIGLVNFVFENGMNAFYQMF